MRFALLTLISAVALSAPAADVSGRWKAVYTVPHERPKMVPEIILDISAADGRVTGTAHMGVWPGDAPLTGGKIEGDRISFTVVGKHPWWASGPIGAASGLPKLIFSGTAHGTEMRLKLTWDSVMIHGSAPEVREYELVATKT